jgi:cyclophilin family peptidyl-prolyl cis-trans isomerase
MQKIISKIVFVLFLSASLIYSQDATFNKIVELGTKDNQSMRHLDYLTNVFGGRITGSNAYNNARDWVANELKNWGMEVEFDSAGVVPVGFNRGPWFGKIISPEPMLLEFATPSYTAGTKGNQKGHVVILPSDEKEYNAIKGKLNGAWVLIDGINDGLPRDRDSISPITTKLTEAGALGTIMLTKSPIRVLDAKTVTAWDNLPKLCDIRLLDTNYNKIKSLVAEGKEVILEFDIRNNFYPGPITFSSVIGTLKGTTYPDEYIVLGAHLDSYDVASGAVDNGSGVARMMEAVRLLVKSKAKLKRTLIIQLFAAEERGLLGSKAWVNGHKKLLPKISVMLNHDSGTNPVIGLGVPKPIYDAVRPVVAPIESLKLAYPFALTETGKYRKAGRGGTDSHSFNMEGVPAPWLITRGPHQYGTTWHTDLDSYDQIIVDAQEQSSLMIALLTYQIANMDKMLPREGSFLEDGVYADFNTSKGRFSVKLEYEKAPMTVSNFVGLVEGKIKNDAVAEGKPYFNGTLWHRVVPAQLIQAGKSAGTGFQSPGYMFPNEIVEGLNHNEAGVIAMANAGPNTNGSQFYITLSPAEALNGNYTVFGHVIEGMDVVNKIVQDDKIQSISITRIGEKALNFKPDTESFMKLVKDAEKK